MMKKITLLKKPSSKITFLQRLLRRGPEHFFYWEKNILGWLSMFLKKSDLGYRPNREKQVAIWTN
jgi:hypothetical protein